MNLKFFRSSLRISSLTSFTTPTPTSRTHSAITLYLLVTFLNQNLFSPATNLSSDSLSIIMAKMSVQHRPDGTYQNIMSSGAFRSRPTITMLTAYPASATAGRIEAAYSIASRNFEMQQRVTADLHLAICSSLGSVTLNEINSKHQFGTGSLNPLNLVTELKTMFDTITKQEIDATQAGHSRSSLVQLFQPRQCHPQRDQLQAPVRHRVSQSFELGH